MIDTGEEQARHFMRRLWLDVPMESEAHFEQAVQNHLMRDCGVPPDAAIRVYNDLYKRVLDKGKEAVPEARIITRDELLEWLEEPRDPTLGKAIHVEIRRRVKELRGRLVGVEASEVMQAAVEVDQELGTVAEGGEAVSLEADQMTGGSAKIEQKADKVERGGTITGAKLGKL